MINCKLTVTIANIYWADSVPNTINSTLQIISYLTQQIRRPRWGEIQSLAQDHGTYKLLPCIWLTPEPKFSTTTYPDTVSKRYNYGDKLTYNIRKSEYSRETHIFAKANKYDLKK